jgi:hypothetical protein
MAKYDYIQHNQELMQNFNQLITYKNLIIHDSLNNPEGLNDLDLISVNICGVLFQDLSQKFFKPKGAKQTIINLLNIRN